MGGVKGKLYKDDVRVGPLDIKGLMVGSASTTTSNFDADPADGILGLGFKELNQDHPDEDTFLDLLFEQNKDQLAEESVCLAIRKGAHGSTMRIGGSDSTAFKKDSMAYYPLSKVGYWQVKIASFTAHGDAVRRKSKSKKKANDKKSRDEEVITSRGIHNMEAIFDSGTSVAGFPKEAAAAFYSNVAGARFEEEDQVWTYPCHHKLAAELKMPDGKTFRFSANDLNLGPLMPGSKRCVGAVFPLDTGGVLVLGLTALRNVYTCLDHSGHRIGLGEPTY